MEVITSPIMTQVSVRNYDPTRTTTLRNAFVRDMNKRFIRLRGVIRKAIVDENCFGLEGINVQTMTPPGRLTFAFPRSSDKVEAFMRWLRMQMDDGLLQITEMAQVGLASEAAWTNLYIQDSYQRGVMRARRELRNAGYAVPSIEQTGGLAVSMSTPFHMDRCFVNSQIPIYTSEGWKRIGNIKVGDLVLTHKGRFRKVTKLYIKTKQLPKTIQLETGKYQRDIKVTIGHPVLVNGEWKDVENVEVGDSIRYLAAKCKNCNKLIPYENKFCSKHCSGEFYKEKKSKCSQVLWKDSLYRNKTKKAMQDAFINGNRDRYEATKNANSKVSLLRRDGKKIGFEGLSFIQMENLQRKAYKGKEDSISKGCFGFQNEKIRDKAKAISLPIVKEKIRQGTWALQRPEVREKAIKNAKISVSKLAKKGIWGTQKKEILQGTIEGIAKYRRNLKEKFKRRGAGQTSIERKMQIILNDIKVKNIPEYNIGRYIVDFAIPELNIVIECDGEYWHRGREKQDAIRQKKLEDKGWQVLRFTESRINKELSIIKDELLRIFYNHLEMYSFIELKITNIRRKQLKRKVTLYNFSVEEDESYIAKGFVVHNCGLLYSRVFSELRGITNAMDQQISRVLAQGIADGDNPRLLARKLTKTIFGKQGDLALTDTLGRFIPAQRRAQTLARTEIIRAHHQATIQEYRNWGLEGVRVKAEWNTAGFGVCPECAAMEADNPYTLDQIQSMIPLHPNCRCMALPVEVGQKEVVKEKIAKKQIQIPIKETLNIAEGKIRKLLHEELYAFDLKGKMIVKKVGNKNSVVLSSESLSKLQNSILTHNHPAGNMFEVGNMRRIGNSFSMQDITLAVRANVSEVRAVTPEFTFVAKRTASSGRFWGVTPSEVRRAFEKANREVTEILMRRMNLGITTANKAETIHWHLVNRRVARELGYEYTKFRI